MSARLLPSSTAAATALPRPEQARCDIPASSARDDVLGRACVVVAELRRLARGAA